MKFLGRLLAAATTAAMFPTASAVADHLEDTLYIDLQWGRVVIQMRPDLAPKHVAQIKRLARKGFYDGLVFHRVIDGFMVQGGDPRGDGTGGSGTNLPAEFSREKHVRGVTSMARARNPDSADSQFFIMLGEAPYLDGKYTIWGKVIEGMNHVDRIKKGDPRANGVVRAPSHLVRMRVASDVEKRSH
jgi:peptidylprolyl isomerase